MKKILLLPALFVLALSGCSSAPGEEKAQEVAQQYSSAQSRGDWKQMCSLLSKDSQQVIIDGSSKTGCPAGLAALTPAKQKTLRQSAESFQITGVSIDGDKAEVSVRVEKGIAKIPLLAEDGKWKVHLFRETQ